MKNKFKLFGMQSLWFCVIILTMLFAFAITACDNGTTSDSSTGKPSLTGKVTITGGTGDNDAVMVGDTLGVDTTLLKGSGAISYLWQSSDTETGKYTNITGKTNETCYVDSKLKDKWIRVVVSRADNSSSVTSAAVQVNLGVNALDGQVDIPWTIIVGNNVTADITQLSDGGMISYQWMKSDDQSEFTDINGATGPTFIVTNDLAGKYLQVAVSREGKTGKVTSNAVKVRASAPVVTGVTIDDGDIEVIKGGSHSFTATVEGTNLEIEDQQKVTWSVTGGTSNNTNIFGGWLNVGADETANELKVIATSDINPGIKGEVTVTVTAFTGNIITITGLGNMKGSLGINILSSLDPDDYNASVASGNEDIINGTLTIGLKDFSGGWGLSEPWDGRGEYYIKIEGSYDKYVYTNGAAINMTNIDSNPKYDFQNQNTTIAFSKFAIIPLGEGGYKITISGLSSYNGAMAIVELSALFEDEDWGDYTMPVADGHAVITGGSVTITLSDMNAYDGGLTGWTDGGECLITLKIDDGTQEEWDPIPLFVYTNGSSLTTLGITTWSDFYEKAPKVNFTGDTTSVSFDKFVPGDDLEFSFGW